MQVKLEAQLWRQVRDDEDAVDIKLKTSATEFGKVISIPTRKPLHILS